MQTTDALPLGRLRGRSIHMVGIKGNGMAALAATLHGAGARVSGSDTGEAFFTDAVLCRLGLSVAERFDAANVPPHADLVVYSAAFDPASNPELLEARRRDLPILSYPQALGAISAQLDSAGIAGSHGKTTTTALAAVLAKAIDLPATVMVPSLLPDLDGMPVYRGGEASFVTETCEYRRHFLSYHPRWIVLTSIEAEHLDYYKDFGDVVDAFVQYARLLPPDGALIYNADDPGCRAVIEALGAADRSRIPYGRNADGDYRLVDVLAASGTVDFRLSGDSRPFTLHVPGAHNAHNASAALALVCLLSGASLSGQSEGRRERLRAGLEAYRGCRRRAEVIGSSRGVLVLDDYGHHPTEVSVTLAGLKGFYAGRRLVVDFMPHTYSRTRALFQDFLGAFDSADEVILHRIYASAREHDDGSVTGEMLARELGRRHASVRYFDKPLDALAHLRDTLREGDVLVTMGAGDNWKLGRAFLGLPEAAAP